MKKRKLIGLSLFASTMLLFGGLDSNDIDTSSLASVSGISNIDAELEKIFNGVREFHIFKPMYNRWGGIDAFTTLVVGQNGFPIFAPRSDKDPKYTDYPIDYKNNAISRYRPVRPPESEKVYYEDNNISLGNKDTATYHAPIVAGGTIGAGRVVIMGSHLYASVLVNPRNYSDNPRNVSSDEVDSADMETYFHNLFGWLSEQNPNLKYSKDGDAVPILTNKERAMFWAIGGSTYESDSAPFKISDKFNLKSDENPKLVTTWKEASENGDLDPAKYPIIIMEDFKRVSSWTNYWEHVERKTQLDEVDLLVDYVRKGGGLLIMDSPSFAEENGITETASNEILKLAGITNYFANNKQDIKLLPPKLEVGGVHQYDMCVSDYIGHTDLVRRLEMDDYSNVPTTLEDLKSLLDSNGNLAYLEEVLSKRERKIFMEGNETNTTLSSDDCGKVDIELEDGNTTEMQTYLVKGDGISQDGDNYDKYANYPIDLNFVQAQGDIGGSMSTLVDHELKVKLLSTIDLNREYTNMSAMFINDAEFQNDEKFKSLFDLIDKYKSDDRFINSNGEFYPGFSFTKNEILDYREKPVTRIVLERAFYDKKLKYDPSEFPGQTSSEGVDANATIYLKRNTDNQNWYAGNMQSTGLYAPAHTDVTVTLSDDFDPAKTQLVIGVGDNVSGIFRHEISLKRPPRFVKKYKFVDSNGDSTNSITVQHPYGGLIFIKSFDSSADENATGEASFTNVQKAVRFVLGETTSDDWDSIVSNIAPKAELESYHHIITVPRANLANLSFSEVEQLAKDYDQEAVNAYDFYGYDRECTAPFTVHTPPSCSDEDELKMAHKNREVFDPHISIGAGHSGYPVMVMNWKPKETTFPQDPKDSWLFWHEMGHNMVESWLSIAGATEVANNVMCLYQQKEFGLPYRSADSIKNVDLILSKGQPWADGGDFGRLLMFHQLFAWIDANYLSDFKSKNTKYYNDDGSVKSEYPFLSGDGFDIFKILHREARDTDTEDDKYDKCMQQSGATKVDMLALCTSAILELDTKPFFEAWKAGVIGIGNVGGTNIYDDKGGISSDLDTGYSDAPSPAIQDYKGD